MGKNKKNSNKITNTGNNSCTHENFERENIITHHRAALNEMAIEKKPISNSSPQISKDISISPSSDHSKPKWQIVKPEFNLYKRALHSGFVVDNKTLVYWGGVSPGEDTFTRKTVPTAELMMFDTQGMNNFYPIVKGNLPTPGHRNGHNFVLDFEQKFAYLIGGSPNDGTFVLNVETIEWKKLPNIKLEIINSCSASVPGFIYIFGGRTTVGAVPSDIMYRINTSTLSIEVVKPSSKQKPKGRSSACLESIKGRYLVLYGGDGSMSTCCDDLWLFDTKTLAWHPIICNGNNKPVGLGLSGWAKYTATNTNNNNNNNMQEDIALLFYGGLSISGTMMNDLWLLNINTLQWKIVETATKTMKSLSHHTNLIAGNKIYLYGGTDKIDGFSPNIINTMFCLDISQAVPKMDEKCIWSCLYCGGYTTSKCSKCAMVPFCNNKCQEEATEIHAAECARFCGEDELSLKFNLEREYYEKLVKLNEEKNSIINDNHKRIEDLENMFRKMTKVLHEKEELIKFSIHQEQQLVSDISQKTNEIEQYEKTFNTILEQTDSQRKEYQEEISRLHQERNKLSEVYSKTKSNVNLLQDQVKTLKSSLDMAEQRSHQQVHLLNAEIEKNQLEIKKQKEMFDKTQLELMKLKKDIEKLNDERECPVCFEGERNHVLQPCGHVFCYECIVAQSKSKGECPMCCQKFTGYVRMFL